MKKKRRPKGSGSIFKRQGKFIYQWIDVIGVQHRRQLKDEMGRPITERHKAEKAAEELARDQAKVRLVSSKIEYLTQVAEAHSLISTSHIPIAGMWEAYLKSPRRPDSSPGTLDFYHDAVKPFQKWMAARHQEVAEVRDVSEEIAEEYATDFWNSGVSERTYNARITTLKMVFKVLLKDSTPFDLIRRKVPRPQSRNAFTVAQLKAISDKMDDPDYYMLYKDEMRLMLLIMLYTGCRGEDAALLKWSHVNLETRVITYIPIKTARKRPVPVMVPIAERLYEVLREKEHDHPQWVLPHVADRYQRNPCGISLDITKLLEASGIVTKMVDPTLQRKRPVVLYSMHSFRHTFCTIAVNAGIPLATIQAIVGHAASDMTAHYSHISLESKKQAVLALEAASPLPDAPENALSLLIPSLPSSRLPHLAACLESMLTPTQRSELIRQLKEKERNFPVCHEDENPLKKAL